jgi:VanZ family protein
MKDESAWRWMPFLLWSAFLLLASTNAGASVHTGSRLEALITAILGHPLSIEAFEIVHALVRKTGHLIGYAVEGALAFRVTRRMPTALALVLLVASLDEINQSFHPLRTGSVLDVLLDMVGAFIAVWMSLRADIDGNDKRF